MSDDTGKPLALNDIPEGKDAAEGEAKAFKSEATLSDAKAGLYTSFSQKRFIYRDSGRLYGQWSSAFAGACIGTVGNNYLQEGSIQSLDEVGRCDNGQVIVRAVTY